MKKLTNYFNNELSDYENDKITKAILSNHLNSELKERWSKTLKEKYDIIPPQKPTSKRVKIIWRITAIAASFLILFGLSNLYQSYSQPAQNLVQFVNVNYLTDLYPELRNRKGIDIEDLRSDAINAYISKDFHKAIEEYNKVVLSNSSNIEDHFYLGLSHLYINQTSLAIPIFQKASTLPQSNFFRDKDPIKWFLSLAYIKEGQLDLAKPILQELEKKSDSNSMKNAKVLLEKFPLEK